MSKLDRTSPEYIEAMTQYMSGEWHEAEKSFLALHEAFPDDTFVMLNLSQIYYSLGKLDAAIATNLRALEVNPKLGVAYYRLGVCYFRAGRLIKALEAFNKVKSSSGQSHAMAEYFVGLINFFLGHDKPAEEAFGRLRSVSRESMIANFFLAQIKLKHNQYDESLELLTELATETPNFSEVFFMMGQANYGLHHNAEAIRCFQKVLELNPEDTRARTKLSLLTELDW